MKHSATLLQTYVKYKFNDITGQTGVMIIVIVVKTNKQYCIWASCAFCVNIFSNYFLLVFYTLLYLSLGF